MTTVTLRADGSMEEVEDVEHAFHAERDKTEGVYVVYDDNVAAFGGFFPNARISDVNGLPDELPPNLDVVV